MRTDAHIESTDQSVPTDDDALDAVTGYEDDDCFVVCHKRNPSAWIRSDVTTDLAP